MIQNIYILVEYFSFNNAYGFCFSSLLFFILWGTGRAIVALVHIIINGRIL